jgi:hypothetical protein
MMDKITIFNVTIIGEAEFDTQLAVSYYDWEKEQFERLITKVSKELTQGLHSGFNQQSDIELVIEKTKEGKELLTKEEVKEIYDNLFVNNKRGHSMRYKVSSDDELTIKAKKTFLQITRDKKLSELGI